MSLADQNPESIRTVSSPLRTVSSPRAPARRSRATSSSTNRTTPRAVFAEPLRSRACSTSPVSARVASRVVAELAGGAVAGTLLGLAADLADRGVHIDQERPVAGSGAGPPRTAQDLGGDAVELADVAEGERAQPGPDRGGRHHPMAQHRPGRPGPQQLDVVDAVTTRGQRVDQGEQLATRPGRTRPGTQVHELIGELLDAEPFGQRRGQQQPSMRDRPLVIERDIDLVQANVRGSHRKGASGLRDE